jgi:transposase
MPILKINPRQARRFAEPNGMLAKTDALDAAMPKLSGSSWRPRECVPAKS